MFPVAWRFGSSVFVVVLCESSGDLCLTLFLAAAEWWSLCILGWVESEIFYCFISVRLVGSACVNSAILSKKEVTSCMLALYPMASNFLSRGSGATRALKPT